MNKMLEKLYEQVKSAPQPWWLPVLSLLLTLHGILVLGWNVQPVAVIFWYELILLFAAAFIRMLFALDGGSFFYNLHVRLLLLFGAGIMAGAMIILSVAFTFRVFDSGVNTEGFARVYTQTRILALGHLLSLGFFYFGKGQFRKAQPFDQLVPTFVQVLILLALLMALTMHLIPKYPQLNQAMWTGVALVLVKFVVDMGFNQAKTTRLG